MKDEKKGLVPGLRFPAYVGQRLRKVQLKDVTAESRERIGDNISSMPVMGVSKVSGIVPMEKRLISSDITRYKIVRKNWFAYNPMRLNIGSIAQWKDEQGILVSPDYVVFKCLDDSDIQIDPDYLNYFRQSYAWKQFVTEGGDGGVRVRIYYEDLARLELLLPGLYEQQKIADCLSSLDTLIAAQGDKVDALKTHKKGLMQQLFPREGETVPRMRFTEFRRKGRWKHKKIFELVERVILPVNVSSDEIYREIGIRSHGKGIFHKEAISGKSLGNKRVFWLEENVFIVNIVFAWEQAVAVTSELEKGMIASHRFPMYKAVRNQANVYFLKQFFLTPKGKHLLWIASPGGAGRNKTLGQKEFENLEVLVPDDVDEQINIADCLSSLDVLIEMQAEKLEALKAHKKALMQQLFPNPEAVVSWVTQR